MCPLVAGLAMVVMMEAGVNDAAANQSEVLTRGLVHQAFAQPVTANPEPGLTVKERPPEPINEIAPGRMPQGKHVRWIPGYWGWDDVRKGFDWVSGVWRDAPPGQRWVPGYWAASREGYTWVRGFWIATTTRELSFLPDPPLSHEVFPTKAAPGGGQFWVPGHWVYRNAKYQWKPGYWAPASSDWIWIPAGYVWTPRGVIFTNGYWDYWPQDRGLLFAPVRLAESGKTLIPQQVILPTSLLTHLFVCADYNHYCFGDYYDSAHVGRGIYPWGQAGQYIHGFYDPMRVAYLAGAAAGARAEFDRILAWHRFFRTHPSARPPTTLSASLRLRIEGDDERSHQAVRQALLARPLSQLADSTESSSRLVLVPESRLDEIRQSARQTVDLADRASRLASARTSGNDARTNLRLALPRMAAPSSSTLVGAERAGRVRGEVPEAPQFDEEHAANRSRESPRSSRK